MVRREFRRRLEPGPRWNSSAPAIAAFCSEIRNLIECARYEIRKLHFCDRTQAHHRCSDGGADDRGFRNGSVDDPGFTEFFEKSGSDLERTAGDANVFSKDEDIVVPFHFFGNSLADGFDVGGKRHYCSSKYTSRRQSSGSGYGSFSAIAMASSISAWMPLSISTMPASERMFC